MTSSGFLIASLVFLPATAPEGEVAAFGFLGMEVYRASGESVGLRAVDLNGDGRTDLVYADNADATLRFLVQRAPGEPPDEAAVAGAAGGGAEAGSAVRRSVNEIRFDDRFRRERFFTEKKVTALEVADFDGDKKPDIAYYGDPEELEVIYQSGEWGSRREKFPITDGVQSLDALAARDIDGDGRSDLVFLGEGKTYIFRQRPSGGLESPRRLHNFFADAEGLHLGDLDGDRRPDFALLRPRASHPFILRFQREDGFGPEVAVKSLPVHRAIFAPLDGSEQSSILAIQGNTRRLRVFRWEKSERPPAPPLSDPRYYGFRSEGDPAARRIALGDVDGDGRADLAVSSAETAELDVSLQRPGGEFAPPVPFPTLAEVKGIALGDIDGDGKPDVIVASAREKAIGVSRWQPAEGGGRLSIPESLAIDGEPLLVAAGKFLDAAAASAAGVGPVQLCLVSKGSSGKFHLSVRGLDRARALDGLFDLAIEAGAEPSGLETLDADGDGHLDILLLIPFEDPRLFIRRSVEGAAPGLQYREVSREKDFGIGQVSRLVPAALTIGSLAEPAAPGGSQRGATLLVAQKSFARALVLEPPGRLKVVEQFPGRGATAEILGAAALNLDGDPEKEILLYDRQASQVDILDRGEGGIYKTTRSISLPAFEFGGFRVLDLNGDGREDAAAVTRQALAVFYQGAAEGDLVEFQRYDGKERAAGAEDRGLPDDLETGDLNADGSPDIVYSTSPHNFLGFLVRPGGPGERGGAGEQGKARGEMRLAQEFQIFEEKSFMRRQGSHGPRQILAAEVTGDGKTDLLLLIHDRIILYPQE